MNENIDGSVKKKKNVGFCDIKKTVIKITVLEPIVRSSSECWGNGRKLCVCEGNGFVGEALGSH